MEIFPGRWTTFCPHVLVCCMAAALRVIVVAFAARARLGG